MANQAMLDRAQRFYDGLPQKQKAAMVNAEPILEMDPDATHELKGKRVNQVVREDDGSMRIIFTDYTDLTVQYPEVTVELEAIFQSQ